MENLLRLVWQNKKIRVTFICLVILLVLLWLFYSFTRGDIIITTNSPNNVITLSKFSDGSEGPVVSEKREGCRSLQIPVST